ncbi:hypothetical protein FPHYL_7334 [Fusarium phyllophilum]|uniref:HNH nuclease domain-containing protein n=1 Tax=Fusarium phyllophilum TaxID=47803 RepID=A0A8H5NBG5_9HYPO|nr:hypothetical protein FPHYL_7334 [Fusarium phyllophilum]
MDAKNAQRRDELKAMIDQRFQGVVSDRTYNHLRHVVGNHEAQLSQTPIRWLEFSANEARERREYMRHIRATIRRVYKNFEFQHRHVIIIMMVPLEELGPVGLLSYGRPPQALVDTLHLIYNFQRHFLQKKAPKEANSADFQPQDEQTGDASTTRKSRSEAEKNECKRLDKNVCIVTETAHPHACHIVPFSFNSSEANAKKTRTYIDAIGVMFGQGFLQEWKNKLAGSNPHARGASDKHWNMLCLSPQLHDWWGRGYFAFEFVGYVRQGENARIALKFHWMPKTTFSSHGEESIPVHWGNIQSALQDHHNALPTTSKFPRDSQKHPGVVRAFLRNGEQLATDQIFIVERPFKVMPNFKAMIDLQFAAIKMLALCGGAGNHELLGLDDDDDTAAGASVGGFNASVQSPSIAPSHVDSTREPDVQLAGLRI